MPIITSYRIEWDDLRKLATEINKCLPPYEDGTPTIVCDKRHNIYRDLKQAFDWLAKNEPDWKTRYRIPAQAIELYESMEEEEKKDDSHLFLKVPRWLVKDGFMADLTPPEWMVLMAFATFAYFGKGVSEQGTTFGETFVSRKKIAEVTGMSVASVDRIIKSLVKKDHLENRWMGRNKVVRKVMFMLADG